MNEQDYIDKWEAVNLSTNRPNVERVERLISRLYEMHDKKRPRLEIVASPKALVARGNKIGDKSRYLSFCGSLDAYWLMRANWGIDNKTEGMEEMQDLFDIASGLAEECSYVYLTDKHAVVCEKPVAIRLDNKKQLHCEDGPSIEFSDGVGAYHIHNVKLPKRVIMSPGSITAEEIKWEENVEVRRIMIERYGMERYLQDINAEPIDVGVDTAGQEIVLYHPPGFVFPIVKVIDSYQNNNGTRNTYVLTATKKTRSALEAVASLAGTTAKYYQPLIES